MKHLEFFFLIALKCWESTTVLLKVVSKIKFFFFYIITYSDFNGFEYYLFLTGCEPDMGHRLMIHCQGPLIFLAN
jgi:hypothetical protein